MTHKPHYTPEHHETPDAWHMHTPDEGTPQAEHGGKANTALLGAGLLFSVGFVAVVILATFLYFNIHMTAKRRALIENTVLSSGYHSYRDSTQAKLGDYSFVTEAAARAGTVSVPLGQAKQNVIARYSGTTAGQK